MRNLKEWAKKVINIPLCNCGNQADYKAIFQHGETEICDSCYRQQEQITNEIDEHEVKNFGGSYGLCPRPILVPIEKPSIVDLANAILKEEL